MLDTQYTHATRAFSAYNFPERSGKCVWTESFIRNSLSKDTAAADMMEEWGHEDMVSNKYTKVLMIF